MLPAPPLLRVERPGSGAAGDAVPSIWPTRPAARRRLHPEVRGRPWHIPGDILNRSAAVAHRAQSSSLRLHALNDGFKGCIHVEQRLPGDARYASVDLVMVSLVPSERSRILDVNESVSAPACPVRVHMFHALLNASPVAGLDNCFSTSSASSAIAAKLSRSVPLTFSISRAQSGGCMLWLGDETWLTSCAP